MLNDELLGAYIDGELGAGQKAEVERLVQESPGARMRLQRMRAGDSALRHAFGAGAGEKEDNLAELVRRGWPKRPSLRKYWIGGAIAAASLLGVFGAQLTGPNLGPGMHLSADMAAALERAPSGDRVSVRGGEMHMALTFRSDGGDVCRQYRTSSARQQVDSIACRGDGAWRIAVQAAVEDQGYRTAAANDPIAAAVERMGGASVLSAEEEQVLIAKRWSAD